MLIFPLISYILIALMLMTMLAKARPWVKVPPPGKTVKILPMGFISRIWLHRFTLLALLTGIVFGLITGWLPVNIAGLVIVFAAIILILPLRYTLTTKGVGVGDGMFYSWKDFSGFNVKSSSLELSHSSFFGRLTLFIKPAEMDTVVKCVERHVRTSTTNSL